MAAPPVAHEERKVVTVLFADLVGFTSRSERLDPEDVRALLSPYYAHLRSELERHGGTVEKFIGDAVMALFGAPVTHEDDAERAVRAALAIRDWVRDEDNIQVRIAVNTGEALVSLGARPSEGEGMAAGDVVNTTARLQTAAPVNGVLVGERTYRATQRMIEYADAPPIDAKGKQHPVAAWVAVQPRSRFGVDVADAVRTPLVGRDREIGVLRDALERMRIERLPQLVTLIGVPGIGKSRLLFELSRVVDADAEIIRWRQGRSLPYGEGVSFWALAEMVKAQAGILDSEAVDEAERKLAESVSDVLPDASEAEWVARHLRDLIGLRRDASRSADDRDQAFVAWRRFVEALAEQRPLVLVFEDLHWADDGLLDFIDELVDWLTDVPLLLVCSSRPELLARRPGWGGGKPNAATLSLAPLSDDDTARLIGTLLERPLLDAEQQQRLLTRAAGNPLFAEQYAQMLSEQTTGQDLAVPETVQDLITARLDSLPLRDKQLLQDAAVVGKVFWPNAVVSLSDNTVDANDLEQRLHDLARRQFVRRERRSSVVDEPQYAFLHVLLRDVAYGQMPRTARIQKHLRTAAWLESRKKADDFVDMLAHHYASAIELMKLTGQDIAAIAVSARGAFRAAGDRAMSLSAFPVALGHYEAALALTADPTSVEYAQLLFLAAGAYYGNDHDLELGRMEQARDALLAAGLRGEAAAAEARLAAIWWFRGQRDRSGEHAGRAEELAGRAPDTADKAYVLAELARLRMLSGNRDLTLATEGLALAESLGLDELRAHQLITIGTAHGRQGRLEGLAEMREGLDIALKANFSRAVGRGFSNIGAITDSLTGDQEELCRIGAEAYDYARRFGTPGDVRWARGNRIVGLFEMGSWDECLPECDEFLADSQRIGGHYQDSATLGLRAMMRLARGDVSAAIADGTASLARAREIQDPQIFVPMLANAAHLLAETGDVVQAQQLFDEFLSQPTQSSDLFGANIIDLVHLAELLDRRDDLRKWIGDDDFSPWFEIARTLLAGDYEHVLPMLESRHAYRCLALVQLRAAGAAADAGDAARADELAHQALQFFHSVHALRHIREAEALLPASA